MDPIYKHRTTMSLVTILVFLFTTVLMFGLLSASEARGGRGGGGGGRGGGGRGGGGGGGSFSRSSGAGAGRSRPSTQPSRPYSGGGQRNNIQGGRTNTSGNRINTGDVNIDRDVNVEGGWGGDWDDDWGGFWAGAVVGGITTAALTSPTVIYSLPPSCTTVYSGGVAYQNCGGTYYQQTYQGSSVAYQPVPPPY